MTAVEWLEETSMRRNLVPGDFEQAKEMEKEQITNAYIECWENDGGNGFHKVDEAEQYYNETFKSE